MQIQLRTMERMQQRSAESIAKVLSCVLPPIETNIAEDLPRLPLTTKVGETKMNDMLKSQEQFNKVVRIMFKLFRQNWNGAGDSDQRDPPTQQCFFYPSDICQFPPPPLAVFYVRTACEKPLTFGLLYLSDLCPPQLLNHSATSAIWDLGPTKKTNTHFEPFCRHIRSSGGYAVLRRLPGS